MLVTTIDNGYQLEQLFRECGRENHFSIEGFDALYDYLYDYSEDVGEDFKVDVIALCCDLQNMKVGKSYIIIIHTPITMKRKHGKIQTKKLLKNGYRIELQ